MLSLENRRARRGSLARPFLPDSIRHGYVGIDHAVDVPDVRCRDSSIELRQRQLEELLTIQSFRVRVTYPN